MSLFGPTPRVNAARLAQYKSQTVRLTGKVVRMDGDTAIIEASDGGQVQIKLHREANISDPFVEILGKVNDDLTIKVFSSMNLGSDLDLGVVEKVVQLAHTDKASGVFSD
ncbi:hypothetical protein FFLO_04826 [Filobasidium floriforme]|uniref:Replication factor A protein 3 n=1 Tax=Filobasidium floriforme TaxID=5210 RepID=A0A8K0JIG7_9TREE|nr:replication factor A protein 3 [Filobasidium floriforme]KAG7530718.1 hypothetical protein FFLO_04826 [Filobasidium floriforme]KAH8079694.1 replication factor A protein 3 [Filobasidium floriforme]